MTEKDDLGFLVLEIEGDRILEEQGFTRWGQPKLSRDVRQGFFEYQNGLSGYSGVFETTDESIELKGGLS